MEIEDLSYSGIVSIVQNNTEIAELVIKQLFEEIQLNKSKVEDLRLKWRNAVQDQEMRENAIKHVLEHLKIPEGTAIVLGEKVLLTNHNHELKEHKRL